LNDSFYKGSAFYGSNHIGYGDYLYFLEYDEDAPQVD